MLKIGTVDKVEMLQNNPLKEFETLPPEAQKLVIDFIAFLQIRYRPATAEKPKPSGKLTNESFIGIWQNREDVQDSNAWVRNVRVTEWG